MLKKNTSVQIALIMLISSVFILPYLVKANSLSQSKEIMGYYTNSETVSYNGELFKIDGSYDTVVNNSQQISMAVPFWFRLDQGGGGNIEFQNYGLNTANIDEEAVKIVKDMKSKNVKVLALIHNMLYDRGELSGSQLAHQILSNQNYRKNFINQCEQIMQKYGFDGVNIDIENVDTSDRDNYSNLIKELKETLGAKGYLITVSIPAKTFDDSRNTYSYPFDYKTIGKYADRVSIMTYDEHGAWAGSGAGPIASLPWQENVIKYAVTQMPDDKILLGIPAYGFDWTEGKSWPKYSSYKMSMDTANKEGITVQWHDLFKVPYFKYTDQTGNREVWFENARSFKEKLSLVYKYNLKGIAIWRLGMEDPEIWKVVRDEMNVSKLQSGSVEFEDIKDHWAKDDIIELYKEGYVKGYTQNSFKPDQGLTRAEFLTMIARVIGVTQPSGGFVTKFEDENLQKHWAKDIILAMEEKGYIAGYANSRGQLYIDPDRQITRAEMASLLNRVAGIQAQNGDASKFSDINGHWAQESIESLEKLNLINGIEYNKFGPDLTCTRAEAAAIIKRYMDYINNK